VKLTVAHSRALFNDAQAALNQSDAAGYNTADQRFHTLVRGIADHESLTEACERLSLQIQVAQMAHERPHILAALETRDTALASKLMEEQIEGMRQSVVPQLEAHAAGESVV